VARRRREDRAAAGGRVEDEEAGDGPLGDLLARLEKEEALMRVVDEEAEGVRGEVEGEARGGCVEGSEDGGSIDNLRFPVGERGMELGWVKEVAEERRGAREAAGG
jgi:hypothetical protein